MAARRTKTGGWREPSLGWARLNERGDLLPIAASPDGYLELGRSKLADGETWTSPAIIGSRLYIRASQGLRAFDFGQ